MKILRTHTIRRRLLWVLVILAVVPMLLLSALIIAKTNGIFTDINERNIEQTKTLIDYYFNEKLSSALSLAEGYAKDPEIVSTFETHERDQLYSITKPIYDQLEKTIKITIFEYGNSDGTVFLRTHNPQKFGDDKSSNSGIAQALTGKEVKGFEYGNSGLGARIFVPIKGTANQIIGTLQMGFNLDEALLKDIAYYLDGNIAFFNEDTLSVSSNSNDQDKIGLLKESAAFEAVKSSGSYKNVTEDNILELFIPVYDSSNTEITGMIGVYQDISSFHNYEASLTTILIISIIVLIVAAILVSILFAGNITNPLKRITMINQRVADGDLSVTIDQSLLTKDEIGQLAAATKDTVEHMSRYIYDIQFQLSKMAQGNLVSQIDQEYKGDFSSIKAALLGISSSLNQTMSAISISADQVNAGADQVSSGAQSLASGATEQAATVEELSASIAEVADQAQKNLENVQIATKYVKLAGDGIDAGNEHMKDLTEAMSNINSASSQIVNITKAIEDIAFQTNILALNAAVEAARAGTVGKGFAVVADEVRNLATKSAEAAKQTAQLIERSVATVAKGSQIAEQTAQILQEVQEKATTANESVAKIGQATFEQTNAIEQVRQGLEQVSAVVQTNAATAEENSATSQQMSAQASALREEVSKFKLNSDAVQDNTADPSLSRKHSDSEGALPENSPASGKY